MMMMEYDHHHHQQYHYCAATKTDVLRVLTSVLWLVMMATNINRVVRLILLEYPFDHHQEQVNK
jgi:hypothetical protein